MNKRELTRLEIIELLVARRLSQKQAADILGLSTRQVRRYMNAYKNEGALALISKKREQPGNHRLKAEKRDEALRIIRLYYAGCGPTFIRNKLLNVHNIQLSIETVRQLMIEENLWRPQRTTTEIDRRRVE